MTALAESLDFAGKHITTPDGQPFSLEGRDWVREQYFRALGGWKLWPVDPAKLCDSCGELANTIREDYGGVAAHDECAGLKSEPIFIVALNLKRQGGKTFNTAAWALCRAFKSKNESIALLAGSEDQVARLFNKNYRRPVEKSAALSKRSRILGTRLLVDKNNSDIELLPTSLSSVGDTRTVVVLDECREVPADVAIAMLPTLFARGGWQCASGHVKTYSGVDDPQAPKTCSVCQKKLEPWFGIALLLSSAGELTDTEADWFAEFIDYYEANPHPNVHVFRSTEDLNPKVSKKVVGAVADVFGRLESTKVYADIEAGNEFRRKGDDVVSDSDVNRCCDKRLANLEQHTGPCVGFLDTSTTVEKTSLVILAGEGEPTAPWDRVFVARLDYWIPEEMPRGVIDEAAVQAHIEILIPRFPGLSTFPIDTRGMPWAVAMVRALQRKSALFAKIVKPWNKHDDESRIGWEILEQRMTMRPEPTIRLIDDKHMRREFKGVRRAMPRTKDAPPAVVDRNRRIVHRDITENLAVCCYLISQLQLRGSVLGMRQIREISKSVAQRVAVARAPLARADLLGPDSF